MEDARNNSHAPDVPGREETPQHQQQRQQRQQQQQERGERRVFDLDSQHYTPQMYMTDLERFGWSDNGALTSSVPTRVLRYPVHAAVQSGRADIVRFMLDKGCRRDVWDHKGSTPLQEAALWGQMAVAQLLLAAGADFSHRCHAGMSALDRAAVRGHVGIARAIIEHGADVNAAGGDGKAAIHHAASAGIAATVNLLCTNGAAFDELDGDGFAPLHLAAISGHFAATQVLLAAGADVTRQGSALELPPLALATANGNLDVLMAILEHGADVNAESHQMTALHVAAAFNRVEAIDALLEAGASIDHAPSGGGIPPLHLAANTSRPAAVFVLLKHGASVQLQDVGGFTALHMAAAKAGTLGAAEVVDILLRQGADENIKNSHGETAADVVGSRVEEQNSLPKECERARRLLANAPADRAWRRRGFLVMCRAHYPGGRVRLVQGNCQVHAGIAKRTRSSTRRPRADIEWAGVAGMLMGAGPDPISLMGDGADLIFEAIVGFL